MGNKNTFVCPRCGNQNPRYIGHFQGKPYCRRCLPFQGKEGKASFLVQRNLQAQLSYPLSPKQEEVSKKVLSLIEKRMNVLIAAVTGAGKTELVYRSLEKVLSQGGHVGFATPRKDVVIDLLPRFKKAFPQARINAVYGGHNSLLEGDILLLTTHQLFRYPHYFDLLVLDEIDAFPYRGNEVLNHFFRKAVKGNYILLSATPEQEDIKKIREDHGEVVYLFERYHHHPLPVPVYKKGSPLSQCFLCLKYLWRFRKEKKRVFIFAPTIAEGKRLFLFLSLFLPSGAFVSSEEAERKTKIEAFKKGELCYLVTTSILERGVTVKDLEVIVYEADHPLYTSAALIQIAGRAGRKIDAPEGEVIFLGREENISIREAIRKIEESNRRAKL